MKEGLHERALIEKVALQAAAEAAPLALGYFRTPLETRVKDDYSLVSEADVAVETLLRRCLLEESARMGLAAGFQGEELGVTGFEGASGYWLVDPIDGTSSFLAGIPTWSVLIAFIREGRPEVGVVAFPALDLVLCAHRGGGAVFGSLAESATRGLRPENPCRLADGVPLEEAKLYYSSPAQFFLRGVDNLWTCLARQARDFRTFGDAFGYACVLQGKAHATMDPIAAPYDLAALEILFEETPGAAFESFIPGQDAPVFSTGGAIGACHPELLKAIKDCRDEAFQRAFQSWGPSGNALVRVGCADVALSRRQSQEELGSLSLGLIEGSRFAREACPSSLPLGAVRLTLWKATSLGPIPFEPSRVTAQETLDRDEMTFEASILSWRDADGGDKSGDASTSVQASGPLTRKRLASLLKSLLARPRGTRGESPSPAPVAEVAHTHNWSEPEIHELRKTLQKIGLVPVDTQTPTQTKTKGAKQGRAPALLFRLWRRELDLLGHDRRSDELVLVRGVSRSRLQSQLRDWALRGRFAGGSLIRLTPGAGPEAWLREATKDAGQNSGL